MYHEYEYHNQKAHEAYGLFHANFDSFLEGNNDADNEDVEVLYENMGWTTY